MIFRWGGGGVPPNSDKEKTAILGQKTLILALFNPFFKFFGGLSVKGGGVPP